MHTFDLVFLCVSLAIVLGGCVWMLDAAAARSSGGGTSVIGQWLTDTADAIPVLLGSVSKYVLLLLGSVVNSALIVLLVQTLRVMDRRVTKQRRRRSPLLPARRPGMENVRRSAKTAIFADSGSSSFLLSPVFR